jgi:hypothetical protein
MQIQTIISVSTAEQPDISLADSSFLFYHNTASLLLRAFLKPVYVFKLRVIIFISKLLSSIYHFALPTDLAHIPQYFFKINIFTDSVFNNLFK